MATKPWAGLGQVLPVQVAQGWFCTLPESFPLLSGGWGSGVSELQGLVCFWVLGWPQSPAPSGKISPGPAVLETGLEVMAGCLTGLKTWQDMARGGVGGQAAFRVDQGGRAECRTHLNFFLATKYCMRPDDLDGGPVVPAACGGEGRGRGWSSRAQAAKSEACRLPECPWAWLGPQGARSVQLCGWGSASRRPAGRRKG